MEKASKSNNYQYNKALKSKANFLRNNGTKGEACLWKYVLKNKGVGYSFRRQRPILNYIVDFVSFDLMLIIEVDGITHTYEESAAKDRFRQRELELIGFSFLRFTDDEVLTAIDRVKAKVLDWIDNQNHPLPPPAGDNES